MTESAPARSPSVDSGLTQSAAPPPRKTATRDDVARHAGVSSAVVSYVVNNGPRRVAPETARRVRASVEQLGYRPNLTARALSSGSTQTFGLIVPDLVNPFFAELASEIERAANTLGFTIVIGHSENDPETERSRAREMEARQVDGLIVASVYNPQELAAWAVYRRADTVHPPTVMLNAQNPIPGLSAIGPDFVGGASAAVRHLLDHGHRSVALLTGAEDSDPPEPREQGWLHGHREAGRRPGRVSRGDYSRESGYRRSRDLLSRRRPPTAIFAVSDLLAIGAIRAAHELGVRVPEDLAIISFDGTAETEYCWPPLTTVRQPMEEMARATVLRLTRADVGPGHDHGEDHQSFVARLVIRRSCGCPGD